VANDRWQSTTMRDVHAGDWIGDFEVLRPTAFNGPEQISLEVAATGSIKTNISTSGFTNEGVQVTFNEEINVIKGDMHAIQSLVHPYTFQPSRAQSAGTDWRLCRGNQVVGTAFTTGSQYPEVVKEYKDDSYNPVVPEAYITDVAVKEGHVRSRVRYIYTKALTAAAGAGENFDLCLAGIVVIRESQAAASDAELGLLRDGRIGLGIYDQHMRGDPYVVLNLPGRLSLCFPRGIQSRQVADNVLTVEWTAKELRYQVDRKFGELTGQIRSLELTEIQVQDSETYYPGLFSTVLK